MEHKTQLYLRSNEPLAWSLFGAGGMVVALISPALIVITGLLVPLGIVDMQMLSYNRVLAFVQYWPAKLFILVIISLQLYHASHRLYHGLHDLHIKGPQSLMLFLFYGGTTILCLFLALLLLEIG